jgi:hypothetical protein
VLQSSSLYFIRELNIVDIGLILGYIFHLRNKRKRIWSKVEERRERRLPGDPAVYLFAGDAIVDALGSLSQLTLHAR